MAAILLTAILWLLGTPASVRAPTETVRNAPSASLAPTVAPEPTGIYTADPGPPTAYASANPTPISRGLAHRLSGHATWFCLPGVSACTSGYSPSGMYAAAGPEMRQALGHNWRGKIVKTCLANNPTRCVRVKLVDWCACSGNHTIDLYSDAFVQLASLSSGVIGVTIRW